MINMYNINCMEFMSDKPDNYYELAIVDPPYGLGKRTVDGGGTNSQIRFKNDMNRANWDNSIPSDLYFSEVKRISKNYIIWGGNYFNLSKYRTFIVWDKMTYIHTMSQVELAVTSFDSPARLIKINSNQANRFHPTQKPVELYRWLLKNYAKKGDKIFDSHGGSGSICIACHDMGYDLDWCELDKDYFDAAKKRYEKHIEQIRMF
jgi:site-specific DNA-methyltransferase (adenine-specific)